MKIQCDSAQLSAAVATVTKAMAARTTMPVLEGVHISAKSGGVKLACTDLRLGIETVPDATVVPLVAVQQAPVPATPVAETAQQQAAPADPAPASGPAPSNPAGIRF